MPEPKQLLKVGGLTVRVGLDAVTITDDPPVVKSAPRQLFDGFAADAGVTQLAKGAVAKKPGIRPWPAGEKRLVNVKLLKELVDQHVHEVLSKAEAMIEADKAERARKARLAKAERDEATALLKASADDVRAQVAAAEARLRVIEFNAGIGDSAPVRKSDTSRSALEELSRFERFASARARGRGEWRDFAFSQVDSATAVKLNAAGRGGSAIGAVTLAKAGLL